MSLPRPPNQLIGKRFGRLVVLSLRHVQRSPGRWIYMALCWCTCDTELEVLSSSLRAGRTKSCGCDKSRYAKTTGDRNVGFKGFREIRAKFWHGYRQGAARRGIEFRLTMEYAWGLFETQDRKCALSGVPIGFGTLAKGAHTSASLDRLDHLEGYVEGNVQWVHKQVNVLRNTLPVVEFIEWCRRISKHADQVSTG